MKYYSAKSVTQILGVTAQTLRNWDKEGKLKPAYTKSNGYRYYSEEDVLSYTKERDTKKERKLVGYVRVSSKKQEDDLNRQKENLESYLKETNQEYEIVSDIGSGIDYNKPGLKKLIEKINKKEVDEIVVLHKDRLLRYGFELIEYFAALNNVKIRVLDKINKTEDEEVVEDLFQIITEFSCKIQGQSKSKTKKILEEIKEKINEI